MGLQFFILESCKNARCFLRSSFLDIKRLTHYFCLQNLKVVNIQDCEKLKSLFSPFLTFPYLKLVMLEELKIKGFHELKALLPKPENDGEIESNTSSLPLCLSKLKAFLSSIFICIVTFF
ncbi:hypothetical protein V6N12_027306 [Hibiscus sabdariffa]|uniref:Leucine-rich repeat domain, L domain-containing protein n=1 Tax=Hibiscus sabdariffa TaxID=183260 RepID=A0ABR2DVV4_9ROSI